MNKIIVLACLFVASCASQEYYDDEFDDEDVQTLLEGLDDEPRSKIKRVKTIKKINRSKP